MNQNRSRSFAVLISFLMITSLVGIPLTAATPTPTQPHTPTPATPTEAPTSSLDARTQAIQTLATANQKQLTTASNTLNATLEFYYAPNRTDTPTFDIDRKIAAKTKPDHPSVTRHLLTSDSQLATTAVTDAQRTFEQYKANAFFDTTAVQADLTKAKSALEKGHDLRNKQSLGAFAQYERAWYHAQRAVDRMDAAVTPTPTITTRTDPAGNRSANYTVHATINDVRTHDLSNISLTVNGNETTIPLNRSHTPGVNSTFTTTVTLTPELTNITARVTDPGTTYATRQSPKLTQATSDKNQNKNNKKTGKKSSGKNKQSNNGANKKNADGVTATNQTGTDTLLLDRDGLTDRYERRHSKTDPRSPDSDSTRTATDEAANGILDGYEDFDDDALNTRQEQLTGTDPFKNDTDGDGLSDAYEFKFTNTNPQLVDTDDDGTTDPAEDPDKDGLTNREERTASTLPQLNDTDGDRVPDGREVALGADPRSPDSDGDTLTDYRELQLGTNLTDTDTDNDGVLDPAEVQYDVLNETLADTDGDGANDAIDDVDADGLSNSAEIQGQTRLTNNDTDGDGLLDGNESSIGTDPLQSDTDNDSLTDPTELELGTDPTVADTDGDGVLDGNETFEKTTTNASSGVTVTATGEGDAVTTVQVEEKPSFDGNESGQVGPTAYISDTPNESDIETVQVTVPIEATDANTRAVTVYVWNGSRNDTWQPVKATVNPENQTATTRVAAGTYVTVLNRTAWRQATTVDPKEPFDYQTNTTVDCQRNCDVQGTVIAVGTEATATVDGTETKSLNDDGRDSTSNTSSENVTVQCVPGPDGDCDSDDDGVPNDKDECPNVAGEKANGCPKDPGDGTSDRDNDGVADDNDDCPDTYGTKSNGCPEEDSDDDGTPNDDDPCPRDPDDNCDDPVEDTDSDNDGVEDGEDNCPNTANSDQRNTDGDNNGDACDPDNDNDGVEDTQDNCPQSPNAEQQDRNNNGLGAVCDPTEKQYYAATWEMDVPAGTDRVFLEFEYLIDKQRDEQVNLTIIGSNTETKYTLDSTNGWREDDINLREYAGETVTIRLSTTGTATAQVRQTRLYQDSDGDSLSDYRESRTWTIPYGYGDRFTLDPYETDTDDDGLADNAEVKLGQAPRRAAPDALEVEYAASNPSEVDTDRDGLDDAAEEAAGANPFLRDTDNDGLRDGREVNAIGTSPTVYDTDGDSLSDAEELSLPVSFRGREFTISTSPAQADTDGDGVPDDVEVGATDRDGDTGFQNRQGSNEPYALRSDPRIQDTDADAVLDDAEPAWYANPLSTDTDGDGYIDYVDPRPNTEDSVPALKIQKISSGPVDGRVYDERLALVIYDESGLETVNISGYHSSGDWWQTLETEQVNETTVTRNGKEYTRHVYYVGVDDSTQPPGIPEKLRLYVADTHQNGYELEIQPEEAPLPDLRNPTLILTPVIAGATGSAAVGSSATTSTGVGVSAGAVGISASTVAIGGTAIIFGEVLLLQEASDVDYYSQDAIAGRQSYVVPTPADTTVVENPTGEQLQLPSGTVYDSPPVPIGDGVERGFGRENVYRTPGINDQTDIEYVINHPSATERSGPYEITIGDNPNGENQIGLRFIGNVLVGAFQFEELNSPEIDDPVVNDEEYYRNHIRDQGDHLSKEEIKNVVENPDQIYKGESTDGRTIYVWRKYVNGEYHYVRAEDFQDSPIPIDQIEVRSAYYEGADKINNLIQRYDLEQIYPAEENEESIDRSGVTPQNPTLRSLFGQNQMDTTSNRRPPLQAKPPRSITL